MIAQRILQLVKNIVIILVILAVSNLISSFLLGFFMALGGNIQIIGLNNISFDPMITIAYMVLFYFINSFYQPEQNKQFYLFLFTLFLSFTVTFIQGAVFLVILFILLRKIRLI